MDQLENNLLIRIKLLIVLLCGGTNVKNRKAHPNYNFEERFCIFSLLMAQDPSTETLFEMKDLSAV